MMVVMKVCTCVQYVCSSGSRNGAMHPDVLSTVVYVVVRT